MEQTTYEKWKEKTDKEIKRITEFYETQNIVIDAEKIRWMARQNIGPCPSDGWKD